MINFTKHAIKRMNQRGISKEMINLTIEYGKCIQDKIILNSREIKKLISKVSIELKSKLLKILDKGGVTVVLGDDASIITVYNCNKKGLIVS
jgi:hypothetical protein